MSTSMYARTMLAELPMKDMTFGSADDLMRLESPVVLRKRAGLQAFDGGDVVVNQVYGLSRSDALASEMDRLCRDAGIAELKPFRGDLSAPAHWKLPMGIEDGEDEVYGYACGYWLAGDQLSAEYAALSELVRHLEQEHSQSADMLRMLRDVSRVEGPDILCGVCSDEMEADEYLMRYVQGARHVLGNALVARLPVLHVAEIHL